MRGWTIPELAEKAGVHPSTLWKMRGAGGQCSYRTKTRIVRVLIEHDAPPIGEALLRLERR